MKLRAAVPSIILLVAVLAVSPAALAHRYVPNAGWHVLPQLALFIEKPDVSQVVYHTYKAEKGPLWLTFNGSQGQDFYMQLGVPVIDRLKNCRPELMLIGPGLPQVDLPPGVPEGLGGIRLITSEAQPSVFDEPFTGTRSWILLEEEITLPADGRYYVRALEPNLEQAKFWVAVGRREVFSLCDIISYQKVVTIVREFHEVDDLPTPLLPSLLIMLSEAAQLLFGWLPCWLL